MKDEFRDGDDGEESTEGAIVWRERTGVEVAECSGDASDINDCDAEGFEIAHRISMVSTHWPVFKSHCRSVLSDAPVT